MIKSTLINFHHVSYLDYEFSRPVSHMKIVRENQYSVSTGNFLELRIPTLYVVVWVILNSIFTTAYFVWCFWIPHLNMFFPIFVEVIHYEGKTRFTFQIYNILTIFFLFLELVIETKAGSWIRKASRRLDGLRLGLFPFHHFLCVGDMKWTSCNNG